MDVTLDRVLACAAPLPGREPFGVGLRYDDAFELLKQEIAKLTLAEPGVEVDWAAVRDRCIEILESRSKDLTVAAYLCAALLATEGLGGLVRGLAVVNWMVAEAWEGVFPEVARVRQRVAVFIWLADRLVLLMPRSTQTAGAEAALAALARLDELLRGRLPGSDFNFARLVTALAPRHVFRPEVRLSGSFQLRSRGPEPGGWELRSSTGDEMPGPEWHAAGVAVAAWLRGEQAVMPSPAAPADSGEAHRVAFVLPLGVPGGAAALGLLWWPVPGRVGLVPDYSFTVVTGVTTLESLDILDRMLDRLPPGEVELHSDAEIRHDLAWGLRELSVDMFARSLYLEQRATEWPRLLSYLARHGDTLAVHLPASDLLTRIVSQQVLSRYHHPALLQAKIWAALWGTLGGSRPPVVLARLTPPWEVSLLSRPLGSADLSLAKPGAVDTTLLLDLRATLPDGQPPAGHPALDLAASLGAVLGGH